LGLEVSPPETIPGPLQLNVGDVAEVVAEILIAVSAHVNTPPVAVTVIDGFSAVTTAVATASQPVDVTTAFTVYVPGALTVGVAVFAPETIPGPVQLKLTAIDAVALNWMVGVDGVRTPPVAVTVGLVVVSVTDAVAVALQPFSLSVTVTV
jgi:hypothetical protein